MPCLRCKNHLVDDCLGLFGMFLQIIAKCVADSRLHHAHHFIVPEFRLGLAFELRFRYLDRHHSCQTVAKVLFRQFYLQFVKKMIVLGVFLQRHCQAAAESRQVRASFDGVDVVYVGVNVLVEVIIVGHGHFHRNAVALCLQVDDILDQRLLAFVKIFHELTESLFGMEHFLLGLPSSSSTRSSVRDSVIPALRNARSRRRFASVS